MIAQRCTELQQGMIDYLDEFVITYDRQPRHQMEMELTLPLYVGSDFHGVVNGEDGSAEVVPVPGGACDL